MKRNLLKWLMFCLLCLGLLACAKGRDATEAKNESVSAGIEEKIPAPESTENEEESKVEENSESEDQLTILSLKGPTTMGLVHMMEKNTADNLSYQFQMEASPDALLPEFVSGKGQIPYLQIWQPFYIKSWTRMWRY